MSAARKQALAAAREQAKRTPWLARATVNWRASLDARPRITGTLSLRFA